MSIVLIIVGGTIIFIVGFAVGCKVGMDMIHSAYKLKEKNAIERGAYAGKVES